MTDAEKLQRIGQKIFDIFAPWDLEYKAPDEISEEVKAAPLDTILYLLEVIEEQ